MKKIYVSPTKIILFLIMMTGFASYTAPSLAGEVIPGPIPAKVVEVVDGDTLKLRAQIWLGQSIDITVRMDGIDTPELRGRCEEEKAQAKLAKNFLAQTLASQPEVYLYNIRYGKYAGRVLAKVTTPLHQDLTEMMIAANYARPYHGEKRAGWCEQAMQQDKDQQDMSQAVPSTLTASAQ